MKKGFSAIEVLIALAVLAILAGGVWVWREQSNREISQQPSSISISPTIFQEKPTPIPTKKTEEPVNWKKYISSDNTYSFKYPLSSDWVFGESDAPLGKSAYVGCEKCLSGENIDLFLVVPIIYKSLDDFIDNSVGTNYITDYKKIMLDKKEVVQAVQPGGPQAGGSFTKTFFVIKDQGYEATIRFRGLMDKEKLDQFPDPNPDILSTFKFLD